jgi:hypothetical protein
LREGQSAREMMAMSAKALRGGEAGGGVGMTQATVRADKSERPDVGDEQAGNDPTDEVQRDADLKEVAEAIATGTIDHHVGLIAHGQGEGRGGSDGDGHDEGPRTDTDLMSKCHDDGN